MDVASGVSGAATPQDAIRAALHGFFAAFGSTSDVGSPPWTLVAADSSDNDDEIFTSGSAWLWVGQLDDGTWIADQGVACG
jgi:hypothetical protein